MNPELDERLSALLDGELSPEQAEALRAELARSPELALHLAALAAVDDGLRALPSPRVPGDLRARIERQLRGGVPARYAPPRAPRSGAIPGRRRWLAAAACVAVAAAAFALVVMPRLGRQEVQVAQSEPAPAPPPRLAEPAPPTHELVEQPPVALADDLPVIEVLDVLAELDELEEVESG